jgi:hypothetical protein
VIGNPEDATKTKKIMRCAFEIKWYDYLVFK